MHQQDNERDDIKLKQKNHSIAIKVPYAISQEQKIGKVITPQILQRIEQEDENIPLDDEEVVSLTKKKMTKSLYKVKLVRYRNKETGQILERIQQSEPIGIQYDFTRLTDFIRVNLQEKVDSEKMITLMKSKIFDGSTENNFSFPIPTPNFLKYFNLPILPIDMLSNKRKNQQKNLVKSKQIGFGDKVPQPPLEIPEVIAALKIFPIVQSYFQKRPCWLRNVLVYQLRQDGLKGDFTINQLKNILKFFSYTYKDGPWKHVFCRFNFNPLQKIEASVFQSVLIKIKQKQVDDYEEQGQVNSESDNVYDPTFKEIPSKYMKLYQLIDIDDQRIQDIIQNTKGSRVQCSKQYGWFTKKNFAQIHNILKDIREKKNSNY